jgi:hypothetical protein
MIFLHPGATGCNYQSRQEKNMFTSTLEQKKYRLDAIGEFERARVSAWWHWLWSKIRRKNPRLLALNEVEKWLPQQRIYRGIREIPLEQIIGSAGRSHEYNRRFQPLRDSLDERWVNVMVLARTTGWSPIQVYKVGNLYFVEDGHHRVSVARWLKNRVIEAEVWEYPVDQEIDPDAGLEAVRAQLAQARTPADVPLICCHATC